MAQTRITDRQAVQSVDLTSEVTNTLPVANGGTGNATNTLNALLVGNGTGALTGIAPGTSGNALLSNGTSWSSSVIGRNTVKEVASTSSGTTLTLTTTNSAYVFTGSSPATWTLPAVTASGAPLILSNIGSATVTVQRAGTDQIWGVGGAQTSFTLTAGSEVQLFDGGGYWILFTLPVGSINATGTASSTTFLRGDGTWAAPSVPADFMLVQVGNAARATGSGDFAVGHYVGRAFTATSITYQFDTADASGSTVVELRRNGTQVTSSNLTVTAANQADGTGTDSARTATISQAFSVGDRINLQITSVGTTPGKGLRAWIVGTWN